MTQGCRVLVLHVFCHVIGTLTLFPTAIQIQSLFHEIIMRNPISLFYDIIVLKLPNTITEIHHLIYPLPFYIPLGPSVIR